MPTARPRHTITETDAVARALDDAGQRWPDDRAARAKLLLRLVEEGHSAIRRDHDLAAARRREAIGRTRGALTGIYPQDYLRRLRDDWPE